MAFSKIRKKTKGVVLQMVVKGWEISIDQVSTGGYPSLLDGPFLDSKGYSGKRNKIVFLLSLKGK